MIFARRTVEEHATGICSVYRPVKSSSRGIRHANRTRGARQPPRTGGRRLGSTMRNSAAHPRRGLQPPSPPPAPETGGLPDFREQDTQRVVRNEHRLTAGLQPSVRRAAGPAPGRSATMATSPRPAPCSARSWGGATPISAYGAQHPQPARHRMPGNLVWVPPRRS